MCFSGWSKKQYCRSGHWLAETYFYFSSETAERNSAKLDRKQDLNVLYHVCFSGRKLNKNCHPGQSIKEGGTLYSGARYGALWEASSQRPLPSLCFSSRSEKQDGRPGLWLAETFSTSTLKRLNGIQRNLTGSKISKSSTKFLFFELIGKTRWPPRPLIGWDIFGFFSETAKRNSTKLDRREDLNVRYQVCVFRAHRKNKMAALASDWLRHFRLLLWNRLMEFNEAWQEARSQRLLPSLCFSDRSVKKIWLLWPIIGWDIFDFSSETAERDSKKFDRKQDLNIFYQVVFFSLMSK